MQTKFYFIIPTFLILISLTVKASDPSPFIKENNLIVPYNLGSSYIDLYSESIFEATSPDWFSKFESEIEMNMYQVGIPSEFQGDLGYYSLLKEVNNYTSLAEKQDFRKDPKSRDDFIRATIGLVITIERATFHHITRVNELNKMLQGLYLRNFFSLMAPDGASKDTSRFIWSYLVGRYFNFPLDIVDGGINELGLLKIAWKESPDKQVSISNFLAGYAAHGLEINNQKFMIWKGFRIVRLMMPLRLLNSVIASIGNSNNVKDLKLWALQRKYLYLKKHSMETEREKTEEELLQIYKENNTTLAERILILLSGLIKGSFIAIIAFIGILLVLLSPIAIIFNSGIKNSLIELWNIISGKHNKAWQQIGVILIAFSLSLVFERIKNYEPPITTFTLGKQ